MGQRSLLGSSAVILAALSLAACSSPLPTAAGDVPAALPVETVGEGTGSESPGDAVSGTASHRTGRWTPHVPSEALLDGTGWLGGGG